VSAGTLYVVATPIGNLSDVSPRAAATLGKVAVVAAEDTRRTRALLSHLDIHGKRLVKLDAHAGERAIGRVIDALAAGTDVALVTDAGTPGVSDPGAALVRSAAEAGMAVVAIAGPSAVTAAAAVSGLVEGGFWFIGFLPRKGEKRRRLLARIAETPEPVILFEAPTRLGATLQDLARAEPERAAAICRELTKVHEQIVRGTLADLAGGGHETRGEITLVLGPGAAETPRATPEDVEQMVRQRLEAGASPRDVATEVSEMTGQSRRDVYARALRMQREG
jgi:16S rRNA (cytidine1402-2'-O)-methyltransferase